MGEGVTEVTSSRVAIVRRRAARALMAIAAALAVAPIPLLEITTRSANSALAMTLRDGVEWPWIAASIAGLVGFALRAFPRGSAGTIRRDGDALRLELPTRRLRASRVELPAVLSGYVVPDRARARAELDLANGDLVQVDAPDVATAIQVLKVAGVDAAKQRARFRVDDLVSRSFAFMMTAAVLALVTLPAGLAAIRASATAGGALWIVGSLALTRLGMGFITLPEITVGTDGLAYQRGPFRRFIPLSEIKEVRSSDVTLYIHLRDGRVKKIRSLTGADPGRAYSLELRVREAIAASRGEHAEGQLELLERHGRSVSDWTVALAGLTRAGSSYRVVGLSADDLDAIVASPDVTPERRIGAALALQGAGHPSARDRIRVAAAQCASPRLRVALERVGEGAVDVEAIAEALAETDAFAAESEARGRAG